MDHFWIEFWGVTWHDLTRMALGAFIFWLLFVDRKKDKKEKTDD